MLSRIRGIALNTTVIELAVKSETVVGLNFLDHRSPLGFPVVRDVQDVFHEILDVDQDSIKLKFMNNRLFFLGAGVSPGTVHIAFVGGGFCGVLD